MGKKSKAIENLSFRGDFDKFLCKMRRTENDDDRSFFSLPS